MDALLYFGLFVVSLLVLLKASDWFIDSAERIGLSLGVSPFIIGVTIVAFGTSLPELATSIASVFSGESEIVVGNVVGSNITNIALVLGLAALGFLAVEETHKLVARRLEARDKTARHRAASNVRHSPAE